MRNWSCTRLLTWTLDQNWICWTWMLTSIGEGEQCIKRATICVCVSLCVSVVCMLCWIRITHTHTHAYTHACTHTRTHTHTHARTHTRTHTHTHMHMYTHTHYYRGHCCFRWCVVGGLVLLTAVVAVLCLLTVYLGYSVHSLQTKLHTVDTRINHINSSEPKEWMERVGD